MLWSTKDQKIILVELMVPFEEGCEDTNQKKVLKYLSLVQDCNNK